MGTDFNNRVDEVRVPVWMSQELEDLPLMKLEGVRLREITKDV